MTISRSASRAISEFERSEPGIPGNLRTLCHHVRIARDRVLSETSGRSARQPPTQADWPSDRRSSCPYGLGRDQAVRSIHAAGNDAKCGDARAVTCGPFLQVIAHVPDGPVVGRIQCSLGIVFPAKGVRLSRLPLNYHRLAKRQQTGRIAGKPGGKPLPGKVRCVAKRVADSDISLRVDRRASHPAITALRAISALLMQHDIALIVQAKLVPAHTATAARID